MKTFKTLFLIAFIAVAASCATVTGLVVMAKAAGSGAASMVVFVLIAGGLLYLNKK